MLSIELLLIIHHSLVREGKQMIINEGAVYTKPPTSKILMSARIPLVAEFWGGQASEASLCAWVNVFSPS